MVESKAGFPVVQIPIGRGDAIFLFSDGFTDSQRFFRSHEGELFKCLEPGVGDGQRHDETHKQGETGERFSEERMSAVVQAALGRGVYRLSRHHTLSDETLEFDFGGGTGSVREAVLALVAVERVFRIYRDDMTGPRDTITMDAETDEFLRKHFRQYELWFSNRAVAAAPGPGVTFTNLKEEAQYDDLTLVVAGRP